MICGQIKREVSLYLEQGVQLYCMVWTTSW